MGRVRSMPHKQPLWKAKGARPSQLLQRRVGCMMLRNPVVGVRGADALLLGPRRLLVDAVACPALEMEGVREIVVVGRVMWHDGTADSILRDCGDWMRTAG